MLFRPPREPEPVLPPAHPSTQPSSPPLTPLRAARYRVWQMWRSLAVRRLGDEDHAILDAALPSGGRALFATMSLNDQRHSLSVYRTLRARGCDDAEMLAAALLHDSGKGNGRVRLWVRPSLVLLRTFAPGVLRGLVRQPTPWWRRPFYNAWRHAEIGAQAAADAGLSERTVLLIRTHHQPDGPAAELHAVDDAS